MAVFCQHLYHTLSFYQSNAKHSRALTASWQELWWQSACPLVQTHPSPLKEIGVLNSKCVSTHINTPLPTVGNRGVRFRLHSKMAFVGLMQHNKHCQMEPTGEGSNSSVWISTLPLLEKMCHFIQISAERHTSSLWFLPPRQLSEAVSAVALWDRLTPVTPHFVTEFLWVWLHLIWPSKSKFLLSV